MKLLPALKSFARASLILSVTAQLALAQDDGKKLEPPKRPVPALPVVGPATQIGELHYCSEETIVLRDVIAPDPNFNRLTHFQIAPTFNANLTSNERAIMLQVIAEWEAVIETSTTLPNPYPITFRNGPLSTFIGLHQKSVDSQGNPLFSTVTMDNDGSTPWFVDATPTNDSEFLPGGTPPSGVDYLSVTRHEVGHALGWTATPVSQALITGTTFDGPIWNIQMEPGGTYHADPATFPNDLMVPAIPNSVRRSYVDYPDATFCARHYGHEIGMKFIHPTTLLGNGTGTANDPWKSVQTAFSFAPSGAPFLMTGQTYVGTGSYLLNTAHTIKVVNGGSAFLRAQ